MCHYPNDNAVRLTNPDTVPCKERRTMLEIDAASNYVRQAELISVALPSSILAEGVPIITVIRP